MRFQFWSMSENSRVEILLRSSSVRVCLVVLNQECCGSGQYNLPDRMLRLDGNTILSQSYAMFITSINITYQSRDQHLSSIHSWDSSPWEVLYIPLFFLTVCFVVLVFCKCVINLTSFLFKSKFINFPICDSALLLSLFCFANISHFCCLVMLRYL